MPSLNQYLQRTRRFLHDQKQELLNEQDLIDYVNQARRETAMRAQAIRIMPLISGGIRSITVAAGGTGYTAPTVSITPPDSPSGQLPYPNGAQATATATVIGGVIISISVNYGGAGYFQPVVTITDATGTGATATATTTLNNTLNLGQEVYPFSAIDLSAFPGVESVYMVRGVSIIYANYRYSLPMYSFTDYQALFRKYVASQYLYVPTIGAQFGQGVAGSLYMYPPPSQTYQLEWDCQCIPQDLLDDESVEALPEPWTNAVPYYAAKLAMIELQNWNSARAFDAQYSERVTRLGAYTRPGRAINPYGRT